MKFFALIALVATAQAVKINGVNGLTTTDSFTCKGTPKQIKTCTDSQNAVKKASTDAYDANVASHQAGVKTATEDMAKNAKDAKDADDAALAAREAAVVAADSNPHD